MDQLSDYDYELPADLIAQTPLEDRASSRLLTLDRKSGVVGHRQFRDFPTLLSAGDVLVVNETHVTAVRLLGERLGTGGQVELLVLRPTGDGAFVCLAKPAKRLRPGVQLGFADDLRGEVCPGGGGSERVIKFNNPDLLNRIGRVPLPPYIHEALSDAERYQTVYARPGADGGSAAAPTAGLHFTPEILAKIQEQGVEIAKVTLEVGIDTFRPVQAERLDDHEMHGERCVLSPDTADTIARATGRIVAVGTTSVRTLETFARLAGSSGRQLAPGETISHLFLRPGSPFKVVDAMLTNFHLPRTTMLMMLSAFASRDHVFEAYEQAIRKKYRFLSFGDAMFLH